MELQTQLDEQRQKVDVDHFDTPIREILTMLEEDELMVAPEYQRQFRWDERRESELIESLLLGLPIPPIFVATNSDGTWELVDGLQRTSSLMHFMGSDLVREKHLEASKGGPLILEGLSKLTAFNGKTFEDLPRPVQMHIKKRALRVTSLSDKSQSDVRFDLFERLNRGGITLTQQEVRACIYRGPFNELIRDLAQDQNFQTLLKLQSNHHKDGTREEQVLKFFAYLDGMDKFDGNVRDFLNNYMKDHQSSPTQEMRDEFSSTCAALFETFQGQPALREGYSNTPLNQLEAVMVGAARVLRNHSHLSTITGRDLMNDGELVSASTKGTNSRASLRRRVERSETLLTP